MWQEGLVIEINLVNGRFVARPHGLMQSRRLNTVSVRVRVAFRPTVSRPVRLGVKPILGLLTRNLFSSEV
jgi:hypothetical protein